MQEIIQCVGEGESVTIRIAREEGIKVTRQRNITFWQAFLAMSWFPVLAVGIIVFLWSKDQNNSVVIRYTTEHLVVTATGIVAGWVLATGLIVWLFRYIRNS
jgi:nitrate reductase NapE component